MEDLQARNTWMRQVPHHTSIAPLWRACGHKCCVSEQTKDICLLYRSWCIHCIHWQTDITCLRHLVHENHFDFHFWFMYQSERATWFAFRYMYSLLLAFWSGVHSLPSLLPHLYSAISQMQLDEDEWPGSERKRKVVLWGLRHRHQQTIFIALNDTWGYSS